MLTRGSPYINPDRGSGIEFQIGSSPGRNLPGLEKRPSVCHALVRPLAYNREIVCKRKKQMRN